MDITLQELRSDIKTSGILQLWDEFRLIRFGVEVNKVNRMRNFRRILSEDQIKAMTRVKIVRNIMFLEYVDDIISPLINKYIDNWMASGKFESLSPAKKKFMENMLFLWDFSGDVLFEKARCEDILSNESYADSWEIPNESPLHILISAKNDSN